MFEESMVESRIAHVPATKRWTMAGSVALQTTLAAVLISLPLLHPEKLTFHLETPLVFTPPPPRPPLPVAQAQSSATQASTSPTIPVTMQPPIAPFGHSSGADTDAPPLIGLTSSPFGMGDALPALGNPGASGPAVSIAPPHPPAKLLPVSTGVAAGMLIAPIRPLYPAIARAAGISGRVIVEAIISKTGGIESMHVVSGPEMLRAAAMDAIRTARYRPFLLNGEPTDVQTTITVNFTLGS